MVPQLSYTIFLCSLQYMPQNAEQLTAMSCLLLEALTKATGCKVWNFLFTHLERSGLKSPGGVSSNGDLSCFDKYFDNKKTVLHLHGLILYL